MGCDIHQRTFLWSKSIRRYVGPEEVCDYSKMYELVSDRYYDLFGLFGNTVRSNYPALDSLHFGLPECLPRTAKLSFKYYGNDYHTFSWILINDLKSSVDRYIDQLRNPAKFLLNDPQGFTEDLFDLPEWKEDTTCLIKEVEKISVNLGYLIDDRDYEKIIDPDKTLFVFYFDN